jgi:hypothetical protein
LLVTQAIVSMLDAGCGKDKTTALADLHPTAVAVTIGEFSELIVTLDFSGTGGDAKSGCPALGSSVGATVNGQTLNVVSRGGVVDCMPIAGAPCKTCAGLSFELASAWNAATQDGRSELNIADGRAIGDSKRYFERRRTLSDRSIPAPITSAQRA